MTTSIPAASAGAVFTVNALADLMVTGPMAFKPIDGSAYDELTTDPAVLR
jgi:hypothetical protein